MPRHFREFVAGHTSPGVFLIPQKLPIAQAIDMIVLVWAASEAPEWANQLTYF